MLVYADSSKIVLAVELDDPSHDLPERIQRDRLIEKALDEANVPLVRVKTNPDGYDAQELRADILAAVRRNQVSVP